MSIYIVIYFLMLGCCLLKKRKVLYILIYIGLLLIGSLRGIDVGTDTANYEEMYRIINYGTDAILYILTFVEPGWVLLNYICGQLFNDYRTVIFGGLLLAITPFFIRTWKATNRPFIVLFFYVTMYFYYNAFNITRQMIAVSIIFFSYKYLFEEKNKKKFYLGIATAMLFHYTSIICFTIPWLLRKVRLSISIMFPLIIITYILGIYIVPRILLSLPDIGHYSAYLMKGESSSSITRLLLNLFFLFIYICSRRNNIQNYLKLFFIGIIFYNIFAFNPSLGRMSLYFTCSQFLLFAKMRSRFIVNQYMINTAAFIYASLYYFLMLNSNSCEIVPYKLWE